MAIYVRKPDGSYVQLLDPNIFEQDATNYYWTIKDSSITLSKLAFKTMVLEAYAEGNGTSVMFSNTTVSDGSYMIVIEANSTIGVHLYINGNTTSSDYYSQELEADGSSVSASRFNNAYIAYYTQSAVIFLQRSKAGYPLAFSLVPAGTSGTIEVRPYAWSYNSTVSDITKIQLTFSSTVNYRAYLYKIKI